MIHRRRRPNEAHLLYVHVALTWHSKVIVLGVADERDGAGPLRVSSASSGPDALSPVCARRGSLHPAASCPPTLALAQAPALTQAQALALALALAQVTPSPPE